MQRRIFGRDFQRALKLCSCGVEIAPLQVCSSQVRAVAGVVRSQTKRGFKRGNGTGRVAHLDQSQPQIIVRIGIVGLQIHHVAEGRDGRLRVT